MEITVNQIRAGRGLLGWTQKRLARESRLSLPAINTLEREIVSPRSKTVEAIRSALENAGLEFTEANGVRQKIEPLSIHKWEGADALKQLFQDMWNTLRDTGGSILVSGIEENQFLKTDKEALLGFLKKCHSHGNIDAKVIVKMGDNAFLGTPKVSHYRWSKEKYFSTVPHYTYANKHAVILWGKPIRIIVTKSNSLAEAHKKQFLINWDHAKEPSEAQQNKRLTWKEY